MPEFPESRWDTLFINADCIVKNGEQRESINEKNLWSVLTLCHQRAVSIASAGGVQISHQVQVINRKEKGGGKASNSRIPAACFFLSFQKLLGSKETKKTSD